MHLRVAPAALARSLRVTLLACALAAGCGEAQTDRVTDAWALDPAHPDASTDTMATVTLRDEAGRPVREARLQLEAQMRHPGMAPVITKMIEGPDGEYAAQWHFPMGGDWVLVLTGTLADGTRITRQHNVSGVQGPR